MSDKLKRIDRVLAWILFIGKWGGAAVFLFGFWWRMSYVLDPPEPLRVSEELTIITEPLTDRGLPDFGAHHLARLREGVDLKNNSAIAFWRAMGIDEIDPEYRDVFFEELGVPTLDNSQAMDPLLSGETHERLSAWLRVIQESPPTGAELTRQAELLIRVSAKRLRAEELPPALRDWLDANQTPHAMLLQSAENPNYYSPPPNLLKPPAPLVIDWLIPDCFESRDAALALAIRVADLIEANRNSEAIRTAHAVVSLSDHIRSQGLGIAMLVANSLETTADGSLLLCVDNVDDPSKIEGVVRNLRSRKHARWVAEYLPTIGFVEGVDFVLRNYAGLSREGDSEVYDDLYRFRRLYEINDLLQYLKLTRKEAASIASLPDPAERFRRASEYDEAWEAEIVAESKSRQHYFALLYGRKFLSESLAMVVTAQFIPSLSSWLNAESTGIARHRLTLIAAAIKLHKLRNGGYPESLNELEPQPLDVVPLDPFTDKPFRYERRGDGFLLYSVGGNGKDDGGSDRLGDFVDGEHAPIDWLSEREPSSGPDDIVVRLPIPRWELPTSVAP